MKIGGWTFLALGVIFLLRDFNVWGFWGIQWWTALFLVIGIAHLGSANCSECGDSRMGKMKGK